MRTTLDLPSDVARTLRRESARRGGRRHAPLSKLVADAVRAAYPAATKPAPRTDLTPGRVVITPPAGSGKVTSDSVRAALEDMR